MIQNAVYFALSRAVEAGGDDQSACAHLGRLDPLLRGAARRRIRHAFREALLATRQPSHEPEGARHILRLAYLIAAKELPESTSLDDIEIIESCYERARSSRPVSSRLLWWPSLLLLLALVAGSLAGFFALSPLFSSDHQDALSRPAPPPAGAFAKGGAPQGGKDALKEALSFALPRYLIALDRWAEVARRGASRGRLAPLEKALKEARESLLFDKELGGGMGEAGLARLGEVFASAEAAALALSPDMEESSDALLNAVGAFNDEMAARDLPYFLDGDIISDRRSDRRMVVLYSFLVEHVTLFQSGETRVRALHLRRLDDLNIIRALLGFTRPHLREALILLGQVEDLLITYILPALAPGASAPLVGEEENTSFLPWKEGVEKKAGALVRAEYGALLDAGAGEVGQQLLRRRSLFEGWQRALSPRGIVLMPPATLSGEDYDYGSDLAGLVPEEEMAEFLSLSQKLKGPEGARVLEEARKTLIASVERHEVQHRLDYAGAPLPLPPALEAYVGAAKSALGEENKFATQAKYELSAYLSELSRDRKATRVNLTLLGRFLFHRDLWGTAECYAALVIFAELAEAFGLGGKDLLGGGIIDRARVADIYLKLTDLPPEEIHAAARSAWERLFERDLPPLEEVSP